MASILVFVEQRDGAVHRGAFEVVSAARGLAEQLGGGDVIAFVVGAPGTSGAEQLGEYGADRIIVAEADALGHYASEGYAAVVADAIKAAGPDVVLFAGSSEGKDLAPRVAARLDVPLVSDAVKLEVEGGDLVITRPVYGGRAFARVSVQATPKLLTLPPNIFRAEKKAGKGAVEKQTVAADASSWKVKVRETVESKSERPDVAEAPVIVAGGRGMRGPENWQLLEELAAAIGDSRCALGASRAVVDAGWRPHGEQVGQTGKTVAPQLYFAVGISGAMQHLAGMRTSRTIVAINKDPEAPIFKVADYGLVGDAFEVLPKLAEEIRKARG